MENTMAGVRPLRAQFTATTTTLLALTALASTVDANRAMAAEPQPEKQTAAPQTSSQPTIDPLRAIKPGEWYEVPDSHLEDIAAPQSKFPWLSGGIYGITACWVFLGCFLVGSSRVDLQACKLEYSIVSPK